MQFSGCCRTILILTELMGTFLGIISQGTSTNDRAMFAMVDSRYPDDFEKCFLGNYSGVVKPSHCAHYCSLYERCHLFCITTDACRLYEARVSRHWKGISGAPPSAMICFSSWGSAKDAASSATIAASDSNWNGRGLKEMAVNGYTCYDEYGYAYASLGVNKSWWSANLGTVRKVASVRVFTRQQNLYASKFKNVEVRVGYSDPRNGNFTDNALLGFYEGEAPQKTTIYFVAERPIKGSVVSIQSLELNYPLVLSDVQILYV
ncbi:uncharacterized protein [Macrobrachium rosenbergii]|uniref:uncharacterized protein n=1 Tax=Macrobrachium rosenbergii TaxID=79674 RepID=UPI0034D60C62